MIPPPPRSTLFPYTTLFRSSTTCRAPQPLQPYRHNEKYDHARQRDQWPPGHADRSEEHTSELQSRGHLVCRLLLEKKKKKKKHKTQKETNKKTKKKLNNTKN